MRKGCILKKEKKHNKKRLTGTMPVSRGEEKKDEEIFWFRLFLMQVPCQIYLLLPGIKP